jgi:hypothetical protein
MFHFEAIVICLVGYNYFGSKKKCLLPNIVSNCDCNLITLQTSMLRQNTSKCNQSLVVSVVIDAELGREDYGSILRNCNQGVGT